jgi:hypothetical protein
MLDVSKTQLPTSILAQLCQVRPAVARSLLHHYRNVVSAQRVGVWVQRPFKELGPSALCDAISVVTESMLRMSTVRLRNWVLQRCVTSSV